MADTVKDSRPYFAASGMGTLYIPKEVLLDTQLSDRARRVLMAHFMCADRFTGQHHSGMQRLEELSGVRKTNISGKYGANGELEREGWLVVKSGDQHHPNSYTLRIPHDPEGTRYRYETDRKVSNDQHRANVAQRTDNIRKQTASAQERGTARNYTSGVPGDTVRYDSKEAAQAAYADYMENCPEEVRATRELLIAEQQEQAAPVAGLEDPFESADDYYQSYTRKELVDMQFKGVKLPRSIIEQYNLDPSI